MDEAGNSYTVVNEDSSVYYQGSYWNDLGCVNRRINTLISGHPAESWQIHIGKKYGNDFRRALSLNCGNGWVERELVERGIVQSALGIDYATDLLEQARSEAGKRSLPIVYDQVDVNQAAFACDGVDLVVNHAAAHHVARLDRVFRHVCESMAEDGIFVSFDYVGPHRNQYRYDAWEAIGKLNAQLPPEVRQDLRYPSLTTMLAEDPTEAIHSELIDETLRRYFTVIEHVPLGGAIAYPLLTHNRRLFGLESPAMREEWAEWVLRADDEFLASHPDSSLFAFYVARPDRSALCDGAQLREWERIETDRELRASERGGLYYGLSPFQEARAEVQRQADLIVGLRQQIADMAATAGPGTRRRSDHPWVRRAVDSTATRRLRSQRHVHRLENRVRSGWARWVRSRS